MNIDMEIKAGTALKGFRIERGWTLAELSEKSGLPVSTLSKIENDKMELTVDKLLRIGLALEINVADIFGAPKQKKTAGQPSSRRSITRAGEGKLVRSPNGDFSYQAYDLLNKGITPIVAEVHATNLEEFGEFHRHPGEEYVYVLEGELALYTDIYTPAYLNQGDSIFFDSDMGHAYINVGKTTCRILSVFSTPNINTVKYLK